MKKTILRFTTLLLLICITQLSQTAFAAPKLKDLKKEAYDIVQKNLGYQKQDVIYIEGYKFDIDDNAQVWRLIFEPKAYPQDEDGMIVVDFSLDGVFLSVEDSEKLSLLFLYQEDYSQSYPYTMGKMLELQQKWQSHLEEIEKTFQAEGRNNFDVHRYRLTVPLFLPSADDYDFENARENAKNAILSLPGWTEEKFSMYPMYMEVLYYSNELNRKVYQFIYTRIRPDHDESRTLERYIEEYEKPLFAMFGGSNSTTPSILSVQLDSKTGDLIGEPFIDYPPIDRYPLDMLR